MSNPPAGISADQWRRLPPGERRAILADEPPPPVQRLVSTGPGTTPVSDIEGLLGLRRGEWRSLRQPENPIATVHEFLATNGYLERGVEGFGTHYGRRTEAGIRQFQLDQGLPVTGRIDEKTLAAMQTPRARLDANLRGPAATFAFEIGRQAGPAQTFSDGTTVQSFETGKLVRDAAGKITAYDASGREISLADIAARFGNTPEAQAALAWSANQMAGGTQDGVNSNNNKSVGDDAAAWNSWCLAFVSTAYGREIPELAAEDAKASQAKFAAAGKLIDDRATMPAGAPVFFEATSHNGNFGHIAIFTGRYDENGDPLIRTSGWRGFDGIREVPLSWLEAKTGAFTGWGVVTPP